MKYKIFERVTKKKSLIVSCITGMLWFLWWRFACYNRFALDARLPFGDGLNPPGITLMVMAVLTLFFSYGIFTLLEYNSFFHKITDYVAWLGKHTLYIYLYHTLFLDYILQKYIGLGNNMWIKRVVYLSVMILGSIVIEICVKYVARKFRAMMSSEKE